MLDLGVEDKWVDTTVWQAGVTQRVLGSKFRKYLRHEVKRLEKERAGLAEAAKALAKRNREVEDRIMEMRQQVRAWVGVSVRIDVCGCPYRCAHLP